MLLFSITSIPHNVALPNFLQMHKSPQCSVLHTTSIYAYCIVYQVARDLRTLVYTIDDHVPLYGGAHGTLYVVLSTYKAARAAGNQTNGTRIRVWLRRGAQHDNRKTLNREITLVLRTSATHLPDRSCNAIIANETPVQSHHRKSLPKRLWISCLGPFSSFVRRSPSGLKGVCSLRG